MYPDGWGMLKASIMDRLEVCSSDEGNRVVTRTRLAIFTSHPIQYQAPWFRALAEERGLELKVYFSYIPDPKQQGVGFGKAFEWDIPLLDGYGWEVLPQLAPLQRGPKVLKGAVWGIRRALQAFQPDAALILGWHHVSLLQALLACRLSRIPIIMRGELNALRRRAQHKRLAHRLLFSQCTAFLAIGTENAKLYKSAGVNPAKIHTARYFVDNEWFSRQHTRYYPERDLLREAYGIAPDSACFCFIGKLEAKKRVMDFVAAVAVAHLKRKNISALVVGSGEFESAARKEVENGQLPVFFTGFLNQSEISKAYVCADVIVLPSDYGETWGLVVNEAMISGIPAIVSDRVGCAHDLVINGETGFVFKFGDIKQLADHMIRLADESTCQRDMGKRARDYVLQKFSVAAAVENTMRVIRLCGPASALE